MSVNKVEMKMKQAVVHVDCCRECPFSEKTKHPMIKRCTHQDDKEVVADEIDDGCPLDDTDAQRQSLGARA